MLTPADAELVRREPALPGLATVLDAEALAWALGAEAVRVSYVRYKPRTSCLVGCRVEREGAEAQAFAVAHRRGGGDKWAKGAAASAVVLADRAVVVRFFPDDRALPGLPCLADAGRRRGLLQELLPARPELWGAALHPLRYKPRRRFVAALSAAGGRAVVKAYTAAGYAAARSAERAMRRAPCRAPRRLARSRRERLLLFEWRPGRLLSEALTDAATPTAEVAAAGTMLARLHRQASLAPALRRRGPEAAALRPLAGWLGHLCPELAGRAEGVVARLGALWPEGPACPLHGDFHPGQVLLGREGVAFLDFDEAACGEGASDVGNFLAQLEAAALRGLVPARAVGPARAALLAGYEAGGGQPAGLDLHLAAGLLRAAPEPFRAREPDWPRTTAAILDCAAALVSSGRASVALRRGSFP